ncbi:MAG: glucose 1-dehydrogenase [Pseudomonadales bacterium]|jgi:3(or 17)beta-hydroxysteroid dehydrogenase|nr:glucose 1-dehydrogenase [Pseudomonadales bacterium]
MARVENKTAIVTGGGSGLGAASSELLAREGAAIVVTDVNAEAAEQTANVIRQRGGKAISLEHNVTEQGRWQEVVAATTSEFGDLDILVNNAGISGTGGGPMEDVAFEDWKRVMDINLDAVFIGCQEAIKAMKVSGGGSIINISSIMGIVGGAGAAYNASKGGVRLLTKSVAAYCGANGYNIRCNSIHPGYIWTPMVRNIVQFVEDLATEDDLRRMLIEKHPIGRLGIPEDIANGVLFLSSEESSFMTGSELVIDGGYTAV